MRRAEREITAPEEIGEILGKAKILHLGLFDGDYPYIVPMHYGYEYIDGKLTFYMHGAKEGHKLDLLNANHKVCVELDCNAALVSGGDVPCAYGSTFASVIARGNAALVTDNAEKIKALNLLMVNQTGRTFEFNEKMIEAVAVIKVEAETFTAKARKS